MNNIHMKSINQYICEALKLGKSRDPKTALDKTFNTFEELRSIIEEFLNLDGRYFKISKISDKEATLKLAPYLADRVNVMKTFKVDIYRDAQKSAIYRDKTLTVAMGHGTMGLGKGNNILFKIKYKDNNDTWKEDWLCGYNPKLTGDPLVNGSNFLKWLEQLSKVRLANPDKVLKSNQGVLKFFRIIE